MLDAEQVIRSSALLRGASEAVIASVAGIARLRHYPRGTTLFLQGEQDEAFGIVAKGWIKLFRVSASGKEAVVRVFSAGETFGEAVALRGAAFPVSAEAATDCAVLWLDSARLMALLQDEPAIAVSILASTFVHLHELVGQIEQLKSQNGAQRVASFLAGLSKADTGAETVTLPYDKMLVAAQLGIKPESLSRAFVRLRDEGVTIRQNEAHIADVAALRAYSEADPADAWARRV